MIILTFSHIAQHFYASAPILFQSIRTDLGLNYAEIGLMIGATSIIGGFLQFGYIVAARRFPKRILLGIATLAISSGCFLMGLADRFATLLFGNVVGGGGQAGLHPMGTSIIAQKFGKKKVTKALSIFYGLGYTGNIISPLLLSAIAIFLSWRFSYFFLALLPLTAGLNVLYNMRQEPAGDKTPLSASTESLWKDIVASTRIKGAVFIFVAQSFIVGGTGMGVIIHWIPQFLQDPIKGLGLGIFEASLIFIVAIIGGIIGTIIFGRLASRFGNLKTAISCICSTIIWVYLLTFYSSFNLMLIPHLFIIGSTTFSITTLLQSHLATIATDSQRDILIGLYYTVGFGVSSLWSTLMGKLIDWYSFGIVWTLMSILGIVALFMLLNAYRRG